MLAVMTVIDCIFAFGGEGCFCVTFGVFICVAMTYEEHLLNFSKKEL